MSITGHLPHDAGNRYFAGGAAGKLLAGTQIGSTDYAAGHVILVDANGDPLVTTTGVKVEGASAANTTQAGRPVAIGGRASAATPGAVGADGAAQFAWFDRNGRLMVRHGDGSNHMPAGDAQARGIHVIPGNGTGTLIKAEDDASANGDLGIPMLAVRKGTPANTSGTDGDYEPLQMAAGRLYTSTTIDAALPAGSATIGTVGLATTAVPAAAALGDAMSNPTSTAIAALQANWNGTSWERANGNTEIVALASAARTTTTQAPDLINRNARGVMYALVVTAAPGGGQTLNLQVQGAAGGVAQWVMKAMATLTTTGTYIYIVMPGAPAAAGAITDTLNAPIPRTIQTLVVHSAGGSWTYVLAACLLL